MWHQMRKVLNPTTVVICLVIYPLFYLDGFSVSETFNHPPILNDPFFSNQHRLSLQWERPLAYQERIKGLIVKANGSVDKLS